MPLKNGSSREIIATNIREMMASGHSRQQSIAAALSNARKHRDSGGQIGVLPGEQPQGPPVNIGQLPPQQMQPIPHPVSNAGFGGNGKRDHSLDAVVQRPTPAVGITGNFPDWYKPVVQQMEAKNHLLDKFTDPVGASIRFDQGSDSITKGVPIPNIDAIQNYLNSSGLLNPITFTRNGQTVTQPVAYNPNQIHTDMANAEVGAQQAAEMQKKAHDIYLSKLGGGFGSLIAGLGGLATGAGFGAGFGTFGVPSLINSGISNSQGIGFASGGSVPHFKTPNVVREQFHIGGLFHGNTPGRADALKMRVPNGSHIIPADVVSHYGQGNTLAGAKVLDNMFGTPYGVPAGHSSHGMGIPHAPHIAALGHAAGGQIDESVPVYVSDGEYSVNPEIVKNHPKLGGGDAEHGHDVLDAWIVESRKRNIAKLKKLPGPRKD